jgi:uncharacterized protein
MSAPSSRDPGARVDPWRAVAGEEEFEGGAVASDLPRLADALSTLGGEAVWPVRYRLRFGRDSEARAVVTGRVALTLRLVCQRCLGAVRIPLDLPLALVLLRSESEGQDLADHLDPVVVEGGGIRPLDLVEDELLLAIPQFPLHVAGGCETPVPATTGAAAPASRRENPFAVLRGLQAPRPDPGEGETG